MRCTVFEQYCSSSLVTVSCCDIESADLLVVVSRLDLAPATAAGGHVSLPHVLPRRGSHPMRLVGS